MEKRFWERLKAEDVTSFGGVPYIFEMLKKLRFEKQDVPALKYMTQAGGKLDPELTTHFVELCASKGMKFYTMYGQSEATARMSFVPWQDAGDKIGSVGRAIPGGEFGLEDEAGQAITQSETVGELVYKGPNVTMGYAGSFHDLNKGDENMGVLHTGDLARRDADGFYYIVGRKKRFLKLFGNRVNLDEVEGLLSQQGWDCVCAGDDDAMRIYTTKAQDKEAISAYVADTMHINRQGFSCVTIDRIPRNDAGKILYAELEKRCG
jgi:acyl-coenzyme A synthetase/AMP-(fatty) acid ligase